MKNTLKQLSFLLNNNIEVNIYNDNYVVKNDRGAFIVVCKYNGHTIGLPDEDIKNCYASFWAVRGHKVLKGFRIRS